MEIKANCEIISPVHIGSGEEIDPFNYVIHDEKLYRVSFERLINAMSNSEIKSFEDLIDSGDLIKLRKFLSNSPDYKSLSLYSIAVTPHVETTCLSNLENLENQMLINGFLRTATKPLIPGSSLKGSFRTAFLSVVAGNKNIEQPKGYNDEKYFENKILDNRDAKSDPFRAVRFRDSILNDDDTIVRRMKNVLMDGVDRENSIQMMHEVSHSEITGNTVEFGTTIAFDDNLLSTGFIRTKIGIEDLIASCRFFYGDKLEYEHNRFYKGKTHEAISAQIMKMPLKENECLIRVGRFSGVESVTLDNYRNPRPPGKKNIWGTSRNLAEGIYPMGWIKVSFDHDKIDSDKLKRLIKTQSTVKPNLVKTRSIKTTPPVLKENKPVDFSGLKARFNNRNR